MSVLSFVVPGPDLITESFSIFENNSNQLWCIIMSYFLDEYLLLILIFFAVYIRGAD